MKGPLEVGFYSTTDAFRAIAQHVAVMRPDGSLVAVTGPSTGKGAIDALACARLFAAAPELLEMVDDLRKALKMYTKDAPLLREAEALIAKARGE